MKKKTALLLSLTSIVSISLTALAIGTNKETKAFADSNEQQVIWKHYSEVPPTNSSYGSKEFWANCSVLGFSLTQPTSGTIIEAGSFDSSPYFSELQRADERYVPCLLEQWGIRPVRTGNTVTYGLYPQTHVNDDSLIAELNKLKPKSGYYLYNNSYYAKSIANTFEDWYYFDDGTSIVNGNTYWFKCEPISWNIVRDHGNSYNYNLLTTKKIDVHRYNDYWDGTKNGNYANNYQYSEIRGWLNNDFYSSAFSFNSSYVTSTSIDNSSSTLGYPHHESIYACGSTNDRVCLLSFTDLLDNSYGFNTTTGASSLRTCDATDYAVCNGAILSKNSGYYWTRSPDMDYSQKASYVNYNGSLASDLVSREYIAVRPSILVSGIFS